MKVHLLVKSMTTSDEYSKGISRMLEIFKVFYLSGS